MNELCMYLNVLLWSVLTRIEIQIETNNGFGPANTYQHMYVRAIHTCMNCARICMYHYGL
jgi:hypothetical protein